MRGTEEHTHACRNQVRLRALGIGEDEGEIEQQRELRVPQIQLVVEPDLVGVALPGPAVEALVASGDPEEILAGPLVGLGRPRFRPKHASGSRDVGGLEHLALQAVGIARDGIDGGLRHELLKHPGQRGVGCIRGVKLAREPVLEELEGFIPVAALE